ncbi:sugar transporter [Gigaspora margarita]|uniref:Sugar transporter n=1 Tax=Gigaspora margarita TaxID=4874 RepID=A0A8H4EUQ8_GIGMA|nr:sugar transporter [Gigaspora margarita]
MTSNIKTSKEIKKKGTYKPNIKARLNSYLLLKEKDKVKLSDMLSNNVSEKAVLSTSRVLAAHYPYIGCLAFVTISVRNNEICGIAEYLKNYEHYATKNWNVNIKHNAAKNLDKFFEPDTNESELKEVCIHYKPCIKEAGYLEIIICTCEQQEYIWKYGHQNLILVNGTFGISKYKLLLFIIMVIDKNNKGVPITLFFLYYLNIIN